MKVLFSFWQDIDFRGTDGTSQNEKIPDLFCLRVFPDVEEGNPRSAFDYRTWLAHNLRKTRPNVFQSAYLWSFVTLSLYLSQINCLFVDFCVPNHDQSTSLLFPMIPVRYYILSDSNPVQVTYGHDQKCGAVDKRIKHWINPNLCQN